MKQGSPLNSLKIEERSVRDLDYVLKSNQDARKQTEQTPKVSVKEARAGESHFDIEASRETTRLLFISQDTSLLNQTKQSLDGYLNLSDVFDEVHILILQTGIRTKNPILRVSPNVWIYVASAPTWLSVIKTAKQMIMDQLEFAYGFRPDLIVARDPFESGYLALWAGKKYNRKAQLHVLEDYSSKSSFLKFSHPKIKSFLYQNSLKKFVSVRTKTETIAEKIKHKFKKIKDVEALPRFYNFKSLQEVQARFDIKEKYRQFSFLILYCGTLDSTSKAYQAIDAARGLMRNPKVGLVVLGDGFNRSEFIKRAEVLGIATQVIFEKATDDLISYLKTADVLMVPDINDFSEELVIKGAAAGIPLVLANSEMRRDILIENDSALFFEDNDVIDMSRQLSRVLNDLGLRTNLVNNARLHVESKLHEDPLQYKLTYRDSVESLLFSEDSE